MTATEAFVLAIVEGLTEFLPVSSTGHLILAEALLKLEGSKTLDVFTINIQLGAIMAIIALYWRRFFQSIDFYLKLFVAFLPAAVIGLALHHYIEALLKSVTTVAVSLIVGGIALILADKFFHQNIVDAADDEDTETIKTKDEFGVERNKEVLKKLNVSWLQAFVIGCFQCLGMIPGVSRSAATIIGGLTQKLNVKRAAEFSFFLGVPTIFAASLFELKKNFSYIQGRDIENLLLGMVVSFIVGAVAVKFFIGLISRYGLKFFGIYRIVIGVTILALVYFGYHIEILK